MLSLAGLPGIYVHSLLGSRSWTEGVDQTGHNRTINRQKLDRADLESELADPASLRHQVFAAHRRLLRARASDSAFHPYGPQEVLSLHPAVFALLRTSPGGGRVLCLHNVSGRTQRLGPEAGDWPLASPPWQDLLTGQAVAPRGGEFSLPPYGVLWLKG